MLESDFGDTDPDATMGNQQERSLAWLAGIIDGEGTISAQVYTLPDGRVRITPFVAVANTDEGILAEAMAILTEIGQGPKGSKPRLYGGWKAGHKSVSGYQTTRNNRAIRVDGVAVKPVIEAIAPYLRSTQKARNAKVLLEYFAIREKTLLKRDHLGRIQRSGYTRAEVELLSSVRSHKRAKSSEAICSAPNVFG